MAEGALDTTSGLLARNYAVVHARVLKVVDELTPEQFARPVHPALHSIGWHVWHTARWDDRLTEIVLKNLPELVREHGPAEQIWVTDSLGERWGLPVGAMGYRDTGTEMEDEAAAQMRLPEKAEVVEYARRVFARIDDLVRSLPDGVLLAVMPGDADGDSTAQNLMSYEVHANRHLGTIEAMKGQLGLRGSATR